MAAWRWHLGLGLGFTALALVMTWPLGSPVARVVPDMNDSFFNIWRLSWVAHQLVHQPTALFDANIFYPARHTLAYSDAMLLVGLAGAPFLWAGVPPGRGPQRAADRRAGVVGMGVGRARPSADWRPVRRRAGRRHRRLRAVPLRAHRPPGAAVADVDAAGAARAARARRAATPGGRPGARRLPRRAAAVQHLLRRVPRGLRRRRLARAGGGAWPEAAPRAVHRRRGNPARAGCGAVPRPLRREPRRSRSPIGHRDRRSTAPSRPTTWRCPPSTCCAAAGT